MNRIKTENKFIVLENLREYKATWDEGPQWAKIIFEFKKPRVDHGWKLREVKYQLKDNPYSRDDWIFLGKVANHVEKLCKLVNDWKSEDSIWFLEDSDIP